MDYQGFIKSLSYVVYKIIDTFIYAIQMYQISTKYELTLITLHLTVKTPLVYKTLLNV